MLLLGACLVNLTGLIMIWWLNLILSTFKRGVRGDFNESGVLLRDP